MARPKTFTSAFARKAKVKRVQTIHELPWLAGVRENADLAHRLWARLGPAFADAVVCPTEHVAAQARRYALLGRAKIGAIPWGVDAGVDSGLAPLPPPGVVDEVLLDRYRLGEIPFALCLGATRAKKKALWLAAHASTRPCVHGPHLRRLAAVPPPAGGPAIRHTQTRFHADFIEINSRNWTQTGQTIRRKSSRIVCPV